MTRLQGTQGCNFSPWTGCAPLHIETLQEGNKLIMGVHYQIRQLEIEQLALLDTAAEWSVIGGELAEMILANKNLFAPTHLSIAISTRLGKFTGQVYRVEIILVAEQERGHDLTVDGSFLVIPEWWGPMVLGYHGFLERIQVAIDLGKSSKRPAYIYFASP